MPRKSSDIPTNYSAGWLDNLDGRLGISQELRRRFHEICGDLGGGDHLSYVKRSLIERALWLEYWIAQQEAGLAHGEQVSVGQLTQAGNTLVSLYRTIGLDRQARAPDLATYLADRES